MKTLVLLIKVQVQYDKKFLQNLFQIFCKGALVCAEDAIILALFLVFFPFPKRFVNYNFCKATANLLKLKTPFFQKSLLILKRTESYHKAKLN
jgi:hypothetical protein